MVEILEKDFKLVPVVGPFFDLYQLVKVNAGKDNEREEMRLVAYGLPLETCLKRIAYDKIPDGKYTVSEYISEYHKIIDELKSLIEVKIEKQSYKIC